MNPNLSLRRLIGFWCFVFLGLLGASAAQAGEPTRAPGYWDLCGLGRVPVPAGFDVEATPIGEHALPAPIGIEPLQAALVRMFGTLEAGAPRAQATAVLMTPAASPNERAGLAERVRQLARQQATDPVLAALVLPACLGATSCTPADAARWAEVEPENASAWLARAAMEPARAEEWVERASRATRIDTYHDVFVQEAMRAVPSDVPAYVKLDVAVFMIGVQAAFSDHTMSAAARFCPRQPNPARAATCARLANTLVRHARDLHTRTVGVLMLERQGAAAPAEVAQHKAELEKRTRNLVSLDDARQPWACPRVERMLRFVEMRGSQGELAAARALAAVQAAPAPK